MSPMGEEIGKLERQNLENTPYIYILYGGLVISNSIFLYMGWGWGWGESN